jgi:hypothetical protein
MPLQQTSGNVTSDAYGGGVAAVPKYIEKYFSTFLYQGNDTTQAINNGIDLSTKGGMVWAKSRTSATNNIVWDTARGVQSRLTTNTTTAAVAGSTEFLSSFNTTGFTVTSTGSGTDPVNDALRNYVSWSFAKAPKFFDVVTYTGTGSTATEIAHNLGSAPGMVVCKKINSTSDWAVWHRGSGGNTDVTGLQLNGTVAAQNNPAGYSTLFTSTTFRPQFVGSSNDNANNVGATYVAYLFAHNAGGFGLTGTDNVISCGSYTTDASGYATVNLGYEPQWVLNKRSSTTSNWIVVDNMRGLLTDGGTNQQLYPNTAGAEIATTGPVSITSTGFNAISGASVTNIYIAIRRGPMKAPTDGTSVFSPQLNSLSLGTKTTVGFTVDAQILGYRAGADDKYVADRLRGVSSTTAESGQILKTNTTSAEATIALTRFWDNTGYQVPQAYANAGNQEVQWNFGRAPSFMDVVCYTGNAGGGAQVVNHNLSVSPELMIVKRRDGVASWYVYAATQGNDKYLILNNTDAVATASSIWQATTPSSTTFTVGASLTNYNQTFVAYLFATCAGVSKCTAFTGTGTLQTINCGFTAGSRFVLIKRTDAAGDWYVWDSSRGLSSSTDPYLLLNSTAAEVTSTNWVDTTATGFQVTAASGNNVNISGASYIALAIA